MDCNICLVIFGTSPKMTKYRPSGPLFITEVLQEYKKHMETLYKHIIFVNMGPDNLKIENICTNILKIKLNIKATHEHTHSYMCCREQCRSLGAATPTSYFRIVVRLPDSNSCESMQVATLRSYIASRPNS